MNPSGGKLGTTYIFVDESGGNPALALRYGRAPDRLNIETGLERLSAGPALPV